MKVLRLLCGIFLPLLGSRGTFPPAAANAVPNLEQSVSTGDNKCWIFMHLQKCGGTTMKKILKDRFSDKFVMYDSHKYRKGDEFLHSFGQRLAGGGEWNVVAGGYPEALRFSSAVDNKCQWFTQFRHPISRMVSAYYYCKKTSMDFACGSAFVNANDVDLVTFAKHWGNFAMRQFALSLVPVDDVLEYSRTDAVRPKLSHLSRVPGWYLAKMYLDDQASTSEYAEIPDVAMYEMLQPVQDLLRDRYTVGILEDFNTTLSLFDAALNMPGMDWHEEFMSQGKQQVNRGFLEEEAASLAEAWTNSDIKKYMQLDLALYEHAVEVHRQQTRAYGIE